MPLCPDRPVVVRPCVPQYWAKRPNSCATPNGPPIRWLSNRRDSESFRVPFRHLRAHFPIRPDLVGYLGFPWPNSSGSRQWLPLHCLRGLPQSGRPTTISNEQSSRTTIRVFHLNHPPDYLLDPTRPGPRFGFHFDPRLFLFDASTTKQPPHRKEPVARTTY